MFGHSDPGSGVLLWLSRAEGAKAHPWPPSRAGCPARLGELDAWLIKTHAALVLLFQLVSSSACALNPKGPSAQIVGFQGPKTIQSMDFGT